MPKITKIASQKRKDRFSVFIDGEFAFGIDADDFFEHSLEVGAELSHAKITELIFSSRYKKLLNKALNFLSYRDRSRKELEDRINLYIYKLPKDGKYLLHDDSNKLVESVLAKLESLDLIDDEKFTHQFIDSVLSSGKLQSKRQIINRLYKRGVSEDIIKLCIEDKLADIDFKNAEELAEKKLKSLGGKNQYEKKQKLCAFLFRKGFSVDVVYAVVDTKIKVN